MMYFDGRSPYYLAYGWIEPEDGFAYQEVADLTTPPQSHFAAQRTAVNHARRHLGFELGVTFLWHHDLGTSRFTAFAPGNGVLCWEESPLDWIPVKDWTSPDN